MHKSTYAVVSVSPGTIKYLDTASEVRAYLWGKDLTYYAIFKNRVHWTGPIMPNLSLFADILDAWDVEEE